MLNLYASTPVFYESITWKREDGTVDEYNPDGTKVTTFPDGTVAREYADGGMLIVCVDGSTTYFNRIYQIGPTGVKITKISLVNTELLQIIKRNMQGDAQKTETLKKHLKDITNDKP